MAKRDYYEVLGVARDCTTDDLKKAYRRLAMQYHPDRNQGDKQAEERFKEVGEAYACLSDPQKRQRYDAFVGLDGGEGIVRGQDVVAGQRIEQGRFSDVRKANDPQIQAHSVPSVGKRDMRVGST